MVGVTAKAVIVDGGENNGVSQRTRSRELPIHEQLAARGTAGLELDDDAWLNGKCDTGVDSGNA